MGLQSLAWAFRGATLGRDCHNRGIARFDGFASHSRSARMKATALHRHWRRRMQDLPRALESLARGCRRTGATDQVHALRVSLRRLRLYASAGRRLLPADARAAFTDWARTVARATSPVRDFDVAMEWLQAGPGASRAVAECKTLRAQLWSTQRLQIPRPPRELRLLARPRRDRESARRLRRRVLKLTRRYAAALRLALPRFFELESEAQHECRRTLRRWRYLHELGWKRLPAKPDPLLRQLILAQEATGDRQNLELVAQALTRIAPQAITRTLQLRLRREQARLRQRIEVALGGMQKWLAEPPVGRGKGRAAAGSQAGLERAA